MLAGEDAAKGSPADVGDVLGPRLRAARQRSGLSLREVARKLGVSASFVSQLENGKSQPSVATLYSMSQLLAVSIDELFDPSHHGDGSTASVSSLDASASVADPRHADPSDDRARQHRPTGGRTVAGRRASRPQRGQPVASVLQRTLEPQTDRDDVVPLVSRTSLASPADAWPLDVARSRLSLTQPGERTRLVMDSGVIWYQLARNTGHDLDFMEILYPPGSSSTNDDRMLRHDGFEYGYLIEGELEVTYGFDVFLLRPGQALGLDSTVPHLFKNPGTVPARGIWCVQHRRS